MGEAGKFLRFKVMLRRCGDACGKDCPINYYYYLLAEVQRAKALLCLFSYFSVKEPQKAKLIFNKEHFSFSWELYHNNGVAGCPLSKYKEGGTSLSSPTLVIQSE